MHTIRTMACALALATAAPPAISRESVARESAELPVLWKSPDCTHSKLGQVAIEAGNRVYAHTTSSATPVSYGAAFAKLAAAAEADGGNAVIIRWHRATYFTRKGKRTRTPVHVQLRGATIDIQDGAADCNLVVVDPKEFAERARRGEPVVVDPGDAY